MSRPRRNGLRRPASVSARRASHPESIETGRVSLSAPAAAVTRLTGREWGQGDTGRSIRSISDRGVSAPGPTAASPQLPGRPGSAAPGKVTRARGRVVPNRFRKVAMPGGVFRFGLDPMAAIVPQAAGALRAVRRQSEGRVTLKALPARYLARYFDQRAMRAEATTNNWIGAPLSCERPPCTDRHARKSETSTASGGSRRECCS
jgi:hypothetical protein